MHLPKPALIATLAAVLAMPAAAQTPPVRIMPMGDSITDGSSFSSPAGSGGYRGTLYSLLTNAGYNVDYVGTQTINSEQLTEKEHEGHSGWRIDQLDTSVAGWFDAIAPPDVILLHIGTNDFGQSLNITAADERLDALILKMAQLRPFAHIIVTNLMERGEPYNAQIQTNFNPNVPTLVANHQAAGRRVTYLDMRAACPLVDMPDQLHPNQTGYNKMANAWLPAIQAVMTPLGDNLPPGIALVTVPDNTHVAVTFSKPVQDAAAAPVNYAASDLTISAASLDATNKRTVTLTTSAMPAAAAYTLAVTGVRDRTAAANLIPPGTSANFFGPAIRGAINNVAEAANYTLLYSLNLPAAATYNSAPPVYEVDNRNGVGPFTRVGYYLELQSTGQPLHYCWASMDAFTANPAMLGIPHLASGATFQQSVANLNVVSNVNGVVNGTGLTGGNIEFWPTNYTQVNSASVPGANAGTYDFGDQPTPGDYGSMQVHNSAAAQTLIAFNRWGAAGGTLDLGIGNRPTADPDWTFAQNAAGYTIRALEVYVKTSDDGTGPVLAEAILSTDRSQITVSFNEPLAESSVAPGNFSLNAGATILTATIAPNLRDVALGVTTTPPGTPLTLTVSGVRDRSPNANLMAPGSTIAVSAIALPLFITSNVPESSAYQLACRFDIPATHTGFNGSGIPYTVDNRAELVGYDRIAYCLELVPTGGTTNWVWVSGNSFTADTNRIAVPDASSGAFFQQAFANMTVASNVPGVTTGTGLSGWLEFWSANYTAPNGAGVPGANAGTFDFGDTATTANGYGSMQIHNPAAGQTLLAYNHWGQAGTAEVGIGNNPSPSGTSSGPQPDWTFTNNGTGFTTRRLYVLVRPNDTAGPTISSASPGAGLNKVYVTFSEAVNPGTVTPASFTLDGGVTVTSAARLNGGRTVELTTGPQSPGALYTLTVSNVADKAGNAITPGSTATFRPLAISTNVPEAAGYTLVHALALPNFSSGWTTTAVPYGIDRRAVTPGFFDRIAYYLELNTNWIYVSAGAFTTNINRVGVPSGPSGAAFQQVLTNMNVASNVPGIVTGNGLATGNIEFWPWDYSQPNALSIPNASASTFDWGDTVSTGSGTHGSMQIHNHGASQVLFAFNNWGGTAAGSVCALGIGSQPTGEPDWTFAANAQSYTTKNLYVLVRTAAVPQPPAVAPVIVSHPASRTAGAGAAATFLVAAAGTAPFSYQWSRNGTPIPGATGQTLSITNVQAGASGSYSVTVTNSSGTAASLTASLTVTGLTENPLSLRGQYNPGTGVILTYTASPLQPFIAQRSLDLGQWTDVASVSADATGTFTCTDPNPPLERVFYRLQRVNP